MDYKSYLINEIPNLIQENKNDKYLHSYNLIRIKRFLIQTTMIFIFQFMIIINLIFSYPPLPMYPPIGISFVMFYLFGNNAIFGLLLGGFGGYLLKGLAIETTVLYLIADLGCGYLGSVLCQNVFSSDIKPFLNLQNGFKFFRINALITCLISSLIRISAAISINLNITFYDYINLWLSDLNAILILSSFLLSWSYIPFSREKISDQTITKIPTITLGAFIMLSVFFMKKIELGYLIIAAMIIATYASKIYGYLIATLLLFIISTIFLSYFIAVKQQYVQNFGLELYTLIPATLLVFVICILYAGYCHHRNMLVP